MQVLILKVRARTIAWTMNIKQGLTIAILASLGCLVFSNNSSPIRTPADETIRLFSRENINALLGMNPQRTRFMPQESREYKCRILNTL